MSSDSKVKIGIVGSQFEADIHCASIAMGSAGEVAAIASPTPGHAEELAERYDVPGPIATTARCSRTPRSR